MILLIDNYDSFVYNLSRYVIELGYTTKVVRNDAISIEEVKLLNPSHIIISPGPCTPNEAGISLELIKTFYQTIPILGVCLGHQAIGQAFGGEIKRSIQPMHGKPSMISHHGGELFREMTSPFQAARYHSLVVDHESLPAELTVLAHSEVGEIMALRHKEHPVFGVQFHPESILTDVGYQLLENFFPI
jgi:para-aminobenzoate synthetase component II